MLLKCVQSCREQLRVGKIYLVIEVYVKFADKSIDYRVLDDNGYPAIYSSNYFEIMSNAIDGFNLSVQKYGLLLSPASIVLSKLNKENTNGFWGCYYEDPQKWIQAKETLKLAIKEVSAKENLKLFHIATIAEQWEGTGMF